MQKKWKIIIGIILGIALAIFFFLNLTKGLEVEVLEIQAQTLMDTFKEEGMVIPQKEQSIFSPYINEVSEIHVEEGQQVNEGDVLITLNTTELNFQIKQLQSEITSLDGEQTHSAEQTDAALIRSQELTIDQAELELDSVQKNLNRVEELFKAEAVSKKELEDAQQQVALAKINVEKQKQNLQSIIQAEQSKGGLAKYYGGRKNAINYQIKNIQNQIARSSISSPLTGIISNIKVKKGESVSSNLPLMDILDLKRHQVEVFVLAEDALTIKNGDQVNLIQETKDEDLLFKGRVERISPAAIETISPLGIEEQRVEVIIDLLDGQNIKIIPGSKLDVEFILEKIENKLVVPKTVLFPYEDGKALWLVKEGRAQIVPVKEGYETKLDFVIDEGLSEGDFIILNPDQEGLKEGKKITKIIDK